MTTSIIFLDGTLPTLLDFVRDAIERGEAEPLPVRSGLYRGALEVIAASVGVMVRQAPANPWPTFPCELAGRGGR